MAHDDEIPPPPIEGRKYVPVEKGHGPDSFFKTFIYPDRVVLEEHQTKGPRVVVTEYSAKEALAVAAALLNAARAAQQAAEDLKAAGPEPKPHMHFDELGRRGYEGYGRSTGGKTFDGREMPKWDDLPQRIKDAWALAARDVLGGAYLALG